MTVTLLLPLLKYLLDHDYIDFDKAQSEILKYIKNVAKDSIYHAFEYLNQNYYDAVKKGSKLKMVDYRNHSLYRSKDFAKLLENREYKKYIRDVINYGIIRYEKEFKEEDYGVPFFKLYEQYQMIDAALLSNYRKIHSSFRGSGLLVHDNEYFLFIDLHKEDDIDERIKYKDKFIDERYFQWQSPNGTIQKNVRGQNLIENKARGINLHLFIRKYKEIDGKSQPYVYIGKGNTIEYEGEKPITMKLELEHKVIPSVYNEFVQKI